LVGGLTPSPQAFFVSQYLRATVELEIPSLVFVREINGLASEL
jgi:hypothetical protein